MAYFPVSLKTLVEISVGGTFNQVAGFLVLSRFADGRPLPNFKAHRFSGAGVKAVHERLRIGEEAARGVLSKLKKDGFVRPADMAVLVASRFVRLDLDPKPADTALPHSFVDAGNAWSSPIARIQKMTSMELNQGQTISNSDQKLDCLMVLLAVHHRSSMTGFGGLDPACACRTWEVDTKSPSEGCTRWGATPSQETFSSSFARSCSAHMKNLEDESRNGFPRFMAAWKKIKELGLIYEAVTLFQGVSHKSPGDLRFTIRVNDFFAGGASVGSDGDPSFLGSLEGAEARHGFYSMPDGGTVDEQLRMNLPDGTGSLIGIWRPRFRAHNADTGKWHEVEKREVATAIRSLANLETQAAF